MCIYMCVYSAVTLLELMELEFTLGHEDIQEKEMETHPSILAWEIPWTEEPGRLLSIGSQELDMTEQLNLHHHHS